MSWVSLVVEVELGRRDVVTAAPLQNLLITMLLRSFELVETLESTIGALIEAPRLVMRDPKRFHFFRHHVVGLDSSREHRCVSKVEFETILLQQLACLFCFLDTLGCEVDVVPSSESVFKVPGGLTMTHKDNFVEGLGSAAHFFWVYF